LGGGGHEAFGLKERIANARRERRARSPTTAKGGLPRPPPLCNGETAFGQKRPTRAKGGVGRNRSTAGRRQSGLNLVQGDVALLILVDFGEILGDARHSRLRLLKRQLAVALLIGFLEALFEPSRSFSGIALLPAGVA